MEKQTGIAEDYEQQLKNEMLFTLSERNTGTVALMVTNSEKQRRDILQFLQQHLKEYKFYDLDLTPHTYTSLHKALEQLLPPEIKNAKQTEWLISITGLENALQKSEDGKLEFTPFVQQLNFERELLFKQPNILVLWVSKSFYSTLVKHAPDLMHWVSKRFLFTGESATPEMAEQEIAKGGVKVRGRIPKRTKRIAELEATFEKLCLDHEDRERLVKDKISLLKLLGIEYRQAFDFEKSEEALKKALSLSERIQLKERGDIAFELGHTYLQFYKFDKALTCFQTSLQIDIEQGNQRYYGANYHQIGMVYEELRNWREALDNYARAIQWKIKTGNEYKLGRTYHQIGIVYTEQKKWKEALDNYKEALKWNTESGNQFALGSTYHQMGVVYTEQKKWKEALYNYKAAMKWNTESGNEFELGRSYHQIGSVYQEQRNWKSALENYEKAIQWKIKSGNEFELGSTYHQIGRVYEERSEFEKAQEYFLLAKTNMEKYNNPHLPIAQASLKRIDEKLRSQSSSKHHHRLKKNRR